MNPWETEPAELDFTDDATGLACRIIRHPSMLHLCGYVRLPEGHPLHDVPYNAEVPQALQKAKDALMEQPVGKRGAIDVFCMAGRGARSGDLFDVHGSITYSGDLKRDGGFWYGFDCSHCDDLSPGLARHYPRSFADDLQYRDIEYVKAECVSLAKQLAAMTAECST
jgi:hypothetical protein